MECPDCKGLGYKEFEHGLIRLHCKSCKGRGVIEDNSRRVEKPESEPIKRKKVK